MDCLVYYQCSTENLPPFKPSQLPSAKRRARMPRQWQKSRRSAFPTTLATTTPTLAWIASKCRKPILTGLNAPVPTGKPPHAFIYRSSTESSLVLLPCARIRPTEGEGVLNAVHPTFAGAGIYGQLINRSGQWCSDNSLQRMIISTQIDNLKVQRVWSNRGFHLYKSYYTLHRWFV